jgi:signal transduction histidine kinase
MRLRSQLVLLAGVSTLPFMAALPWALHEVQGTFDEELDRRLVGAGAAAQAALSDLGVQVERAVRDLATDPNVEDIAHSLDKEGFDRAAVVPLGERLMALSGLDALELLDAEGRILTSGHLPARAGDPDRDALELGGVRPGKAAPRRIEFRSADGIAPTLAVVAVRPVDYGSGRIWVVGARLIGGAWARQVSELTGAAVSVREAGRELARSGSLPDPRVRVIPIGDAGQKLGAVQVELSDQGLREAQARIVRGAALLWALLLAATMALGVILARRMTRPVDALAQGARELAQGGFGRQIQVRASGEMRDLVVAFNAMSRDIKNATERAAVAERVAAWQGIARRLAHEIKNPLTPIRMSVETLVAAHRTHRPDFDEIFKESAGAVLEEVERLRRIVDEFSKFARLPKPNLARLDLAELAAGVLTLYNAPPDGIRIHRELAQALLVDVDRDQITQVLINLLTNAEQAMEGRQGTISVRVLPLGATEVVLEVEDEGPGVAPEDRSRIFEPYFTKKTGGTGLGLAIALRIAQEHNGRLEELGTQGRGAWFRLALPRAKENEALPQ